MTTSKLVNDLGPVGNLGYKSQSIYVTFLFMFNTDIFDINTRNFTESVTCWACGYVAQMAEASANKTVFILSKI